MAILVERQYQQLLGLREVRADGSEHSNETRQSAVTARPNQTAQNSTALVTSGGAGSRRLAPAAINHKNKGLARSATLGGFLAAALIGSAAPASAAALVAVGHSTVIAVQGPGNSLDFYWQAVGTRPWHPEVVAGPGTTYSPPSVAAVGHSTVIAVQGPGNSLDFYWQAVGTRPWHPEVVAGPGTTYSPPSVAAVGHSTVIAVQGPGTAWTSTGRPSAPGPGTRKWSPARGRRTRRPRWRRSVTRR